MLNEQKLRQSISKRLNESNAEIVKNFCVFHPSQFSINKKNGSVYAREMPPTKRQKNLSYFPAGFQPTVKQAEENLSEDEKFIILKPEKIPTVQISSYLLGLTNRMVHQNTKSLHSDTVEQNGKKLIGEKEERIQKFVRKLKAKKNIDNYIKTKRQQETEEIELPQLEKKAQKTQEQSNISSKLTKSTLTPKLQYKNKSDQIKNTPKAEEKKNQKKVLPTKYDTKKFFQPVSLIIYKGYLFYEEGAHEFLQKNLQNIHKVPEKRITTTNITASNYLLVDQTTLSIIGEKRSEEMIEIASLTKIMTCYLCILACKKYGIDMEHYWIRVSDKAAQMPGTSAQLQAGDIISINQLLYGLMLPSGNDASVAIAETIGKIIQKNKKKPSSKTYYETFIAHMNIFAHEIEIQQEYNNSSGLSYKPNLSTPKAITILTALALRNKKFYEVINTKQYQVQLKNERFGLLRKQSWKNTNKLLWKGWQGVKTGTTETAGHCLMSLKENLLVSVFDCQTLNKRFSECVKLYQKYTN